MTVQFAANHYEIKRRSLHYHFLMTMGFMFSASRKPYFLQISDWSSIPLTNASIVSDVKIILLIVDEAGLGLILFESIVH
ncbi:hypothetical protein [Candidatus Nitrosocosmicus arcticus]|uniref:hypothetical protein n=1 Tax=Candidatus Nitrosocosmicus arcticus TaxID=2035267 RepID=UPI0011A1966F|nr:hypothetical protein [Candidatus Nitrosocosmicus arcticus]